MGSYRTVKSSLNGSGPITQKNLAELAGVSMTTVYNALHSKHLVRSKTLQRIHELIEEYDYHPNGIAQAMVRGKTNIIGIIVPRIDVSYFAALIANIEPEVNGIGCNCFICQHLDDMLKEEREIRLMRERRVDGLIIRASGRRENAKIYHRLEKIGLPFVLIDRQIKGLEDHYVGLDGSRACRDMMKYLIDKGHRRIAIVYWPESATKPGSKFETCCDTLKQHGIELEKRFIVECSHEYEPPYEEVLRMLQNAGTDKPTAVLAINTTSAIGTIRAANALGMRIPDDIAVAHVGGGIEGQFASLLSIKPTCSVHPVETIAREAAHMLRDQIDGENWRRGPVLCPSEIRVGTSA